MKTNAGIALALALLAGTTGAQSIDLQVLEGDERTACEVILCLSSGQRPDECTPPLERYFSIKKKKLSDTLKARRSFLDQCPAADDSTEMKGLVSALANGAGRCDAASLNGNTTWSAYGEGEQYISNVMPAYCSIYIHHAYTDLSPIAPRYVGTPERGGYWLEADQYEQALAQYNARTAAEDARYWGSN